MSRKQGKLFDELSDPPLVRAADRVIELRKEKKSITEKLDAQEKNLIGLMYKAKKETIRHGGYLIRIKLSESKNKIVLKSIPQSEPKNEKIDRTS